MIVFLAWLPLAAQHWRKGVAHIVFVDMGDFNPAGQGFGLRVDLFAADDPDIGRRVAKCQCILQAACVQGAICFPTSLPRDNDIAPAGQGAKPGWQ